MFKRCLALAELHGREGCNREPGNWFRLALLVVAWGRDLLTHTLYPHQGKEQGLGQGSQTLQREHMVTERLRQHLLTLLMIHP